MLNPLNIPRKMRLVDVAITTRSFMVVFSEATSLCIEKMALRMAEFEYEKNKELQQSDYLESPRRSPSANKLKPTASSKSQAPKKFFTFEPSNLPLIKKDSERDKNTPLDSSRLKKVKSRIYDKIETEQISNEERLLRNIGLRQAVSKKIKGSLQFLSEMQKHRSDDARTSASHLVNAHQFDLPEEEKRAVHKQPAVLLSDYDHKSSSQLSVLAYSKGDQSRAIWMKIVADGKQEDLFNYTLKYLLEKPVGKGIPKKPRESTKKYKLDDSILRKSVEVKGSELFSEAQKGLSETTLLLKAVKEDMSQCQNLKNFV